MRVTIVGVGLIGGSIGLALRAARSSDYEVVGWDTDAAALAGALERGAIDRAAQGAAAAAAAADLVVVATPVDLMPQTFAALAGAVPAHAVVTDAGSAKVAVVEAGEAHWGSRFVGGHPMAGSERHGIEAADERLFDDAWWIMTPTSTTSSTSYALVADLVTATGARPVAVDPLVHDDLVARLSHLPQITASALVEVAVASGDGDTLLGLAAGGFRDVTRIAASSPDLWVAIIRSNARAVLEALEGLRGRLAGAGELIAEGRWDELRAWLDRSRRARTELFAKRAFSGEPVGLSLMIPDRPGVLAQVTTAAGELGVNIEDLRIVHSTEGGRGRLELVVAGSEGAELLVGTLMGLGYRVARTEIN